VQVYQYIHTLLCKFIITVVIVCKYTGIYTFQNKQQYILHKEMTQLI